MRREIKFKVWNESLKMWVDSKHFCVGADGGILFWNDGKKLWHDAAPHYKLITFTGLHDKNGKEIWEGDVIQPQQFNNQPLPNHMVYWRSDLSRFDCKGMGWSQEFWHIAKYGEVIGNIYENPELLK